MVDNLADNLTIILEWRRTSLFFCGKVRKMKEVTNLMINEFALREKGTDFMGYSLQREGETYTFHHLIVPRRECAKKGHGHGYFRWNGAIIFSNSHNYLHKIEQYDYDTFLAITSEMIDMNVQGRLTKENLLEIRRLLMDFEERYQGKLSKKGRPIIKDSYTKRLTLEQIEKRF